MSRHITRLFSALIVLAWISGCTSPLESGPTPVPSESDAMSALEAMGLSGERSISFSAVPLTDGKLEALAQEQLGISTSDVRAITSELSVWPKDAQAEPYITMVRFGWITFPQSAGESQKVTPQFTPLGEEKLAALQARTTAPYMVWQVSPCTPKVQGIRSIEQEKTRADLPDVKQIARVEYDVAEELNELGTALNASCDPEPKMKVASLRNSGDGWVAK